jgi:hypothetical protein
MNKNYEHESRIRIYQEFDVKYDDPSAIDEIIELVGNPSVFDYSCSDFSCTKLTETPQCQVVKGTTEEEEYSTCCECGSRMTHVRPGKWQCDTCDNLDVWMSAAKAMHGFLQSIEHGCEDGRHKVDDEFLSRLQKFNLGYKNLCDPDE